MPVTGFLHLADIKPPYALEGTPLAKECEVEVKKGIHLTAYVKDVFPNAGRMTLSLDPNINKDKVCALAHVQSRAAVAAWYPEITPKGSFVVSHRIDEAAQFCHARVPFWFSTR